MNNVTMNSEKFVYNILPRLTDVITHKTLIQIRRLNKVWMYLFRSMSVERVADRYTDRSAKLIAFRAYLMHLPIQGSTEWLASRAGTNRDYLRETILKLHNLSQDYQFPPTVGGSEIASLLGEDKHKNPAGLMRSKLGIEKFDGNIHTNWGKMFEEVLRSWTETIFQTELYETGSVPGLRNCYGMPIQSYSPDGVGLVTRDRLAKVLENENIKFTQTDEYRKLLGDSDDRIVLYEFKCPLMRKPDGTVPTQYRSQPRLGMTTLGIPEFAIFGDATFRKCCVEDFNFEPTYDLCLPPTARDRVKQEAPTALGFIGVYEEGGREKTRGTEADMKGVTRKIVNSLFSELQVKDFEKLPRDVNTISLVSIKLYDSIMDTCQFEFDDETRLRILWNAVRSSMPNLQSMNREEAYRSVYNAIKLIDTARVGLTDLEYGIDFGYTKYGGGRFDCFELFDAKKMRDALSCSSITMEEFYNLMVQTNTPGNELGLKFYYPGKFCYQMTNAFAQDLARNNYVDTHLSNHKRCRKWLWQNVKDFENFCFKEGHKSVGIIPYKLLTVKYVPVYKEPDFLEKVEPVIKKFQENLEKCRAGTNDPLLMDRRTCDIYNVAPMLSQTVSENSFDDISVEGTIAPAGLSFDDLDLIG